MHDKNSPEGRVLHDVPRARTKKKKRSIVGIGPSVGDDDDDDDGGTYTQTFD